MIGVITGFLGILLVMLSSGPGQMIRGAGVALASFGLVMVTIGPILRLPLERKATLLSYLGAAISLLAIAWFLSAFPDAWGAAFNNQEVKIIGLYGLGILTIASGGVFVALLTRSTPEQDAAEDRAAQAEAKRDAAIDEIGANNERDERIVDLKKELAAREREIEELQSDLSDGSSDRHALAAVIEDLRAGESQFELYEDQGGRWR